MSVIWTAGGIYKRAHYQNEADFEAAINEVRHQLFGANRIYLDVKKKIGLKGGIQNIPDGYLIDLAGPKPRLYVVENELRVHDALRHIAVQILQFSLSFESEQIAVKQILLGAIEAQPAIKATCEAYAVKNSFRNVDHILEHLIF